VDGRLDELVTRVELELEAVLVLVLVAPPASGVPLKGLPHATREPAAKLPQSTALMQVDTVALMVEPICQNLMR